MRLETGGYFELELGKHNDLHSKGLFLNSARNCLKHILLHKEISKIYLPFYTCEVLLEPIIQCKVAYEFYSIDDQLEPILNFEIEDDSAILFINYFGVKTDNIISLANRFDFVIIDNSQALFCEPIENTHCFYSPRKFIGMPDGGVLFSDAMNNNYEIDYSVDRASHLLIRLDSNAKNGYPVFCENDSEISNLPILQISKLSRAIYDNASLDIIKEKRNTNFNYLHSFFKDTNELNLITSNCGPLVYPLLIEGGSLLKNKLIQNDVFVATYWKNIVPYLNENSIESYLVENLVPLPIDQRITKEELDKIISLAQL